MYTIRKLRKGDEDIIYSLLHSCGRLIQILSCYEDSSKLKLGDVLEMTANPNFDPAGAFFICRGDQEIGFAVASQGSLHFFHLQPEHFDAAAEMLLDHLSKWQQQKGADRVRQDRMKLIEGSISTISDVFRLEEEKKYIDLFVSKGFTRSPECGNMVVELEDFRWTEEQKALEDKLRADGIAVKGAERNEISAFVRGRLVRSSVYKDLYKEIVMPYLNSTECDALQLAWDKTQIIGYCAFFPWTLHFPMPEIGYILVDQSYRRRGIGQMLLYHLLEWGKRHGAKKVRLSCIDTSDMPRFHIYAKVGFRVTGEKWYQSMERII